MWGKLATGASVLALTVSCASSTPSVYVPKAGPSQAQPTTSATSAALPTGAGLGATAGEWAQTHRADTSQPAGTFYDPDPSLDLPADQGKTADRFNGLITNDGRVTDYSERFTARTSEATARTTVRVGLPSDVTNVWSTTVAECAAEVVHSNQLATKLGSVIPDKSGLVLIEYFSTSNQYDAANVERALLQPGGDDPTEKSFHDC